MNVLSRVRVSGVLSALLLALLAGCGSGAADGPSPSGTTPAGASAPAPATHSPTATAPNPTPTTPPATAATPPTTAAGTNGATAAPSWLGTRVLPIGPDGYGVSKGTPKELRNRRIITVDRLPPPADGGFHSRIRAVPAAIAKRSTWSAGCPVRLNRLRYVTVSFRGFDGRAHTGELLLNRSVAGDVVTVFRRLFAAGWPIEEMRISSPADLSAPPTGDGNDTSAFVCRPVRGRTTAWSQHAYGLAIDVNPFLNPYVHGRTILPEVADSYTDRLWTRPGMNTPGSVPDRAFRSIGWGWGGTYTTKKDWMHFSSTGR
jgi:hypothetical protein